MLIAATPRHAHAPSSIGCVKATQTQGQVIHGTGCKSDDVHQKGLVKQEDTLLTSWAAQHARSGMVAFGWKQHIPAD
eukprot:1156674-Pelagomonas_calceolata.AAC.17